jgi:hypothetical protein
MKNPKEILPDDAFKSLQNWEAEYNPQDWMDMEKMLDQEENKAIPFVLPTETKPKRKTKKIILLMTLLSMMGIAGYLMLSTPQMSKKPLSSKENLKGLEKETEVPNNYKLFDNTELENKSTTTDKTTNPKKHNLNIKSAVNHKIGTPKELKNSDNLHNEFALSQEIQLKESTGNNLTGKPLDRNKNAKNNPIQKEQKNESIQDKIERDTALQEIRQTFQKNVYRKIWVPEEYEYIYQSEYSPIQDFWIGIHFTGQREWSQELYNSGGFNLQFMSGHAKRLKTNKIGIYGGLDFGVQFMGKSEKSNVELNTTTLDSGFTRLSNRAYDIFARFHAEYTGNFIVPYFTAFAGPRINATGQLVKSYTPLIDHERSSYNNAYTSASLNYGFGVGVRVQLNKTISLDARYEYMGATEAKLMDLNNAQFNGLSYRRNLSNLAQEYNFFKFGVIFNLSTSRYEKKLVKEGYYKETVYDSLTIDSADENIRYLPCKDLPCDQKTFKTKYKVEEAEENETPSNGNGGIYKETESEIRTVPHRNRNRTGTSSGGNTTRPAPTIKAPSPKPTPKA